MSLPGTVLLALGFAIFSSLSLLLNPVFALPLAAARAGTAGYGFVKYGWKGWPAMLGAPFALYPVLITVGIYLACAVGRGCI